MEGGAVVVGYQTLGVVVEAAAPADLVSATDAVLLEMSWQQQPS